MVRVAVMAGSQCCKFWRRHRWSKKHEISGKVKYDDTEGNLLKEYLGEPLDLKVLPSDALHYST
jgi:hypothetical protein